MKMTYFFFPSIIIFILKTSYLLENGKKDYNYYKMCFSHFTALNFEVLVVTNKEINKK